LPFREKFGQQEEELRVNRKAVLQRLLGKTGDGKNGRTSGK
jgi:hypothetical protein